MDDVVDLGAWIVRATAGDVAGGAVVAATVVVERAAGLVVAVVAVVAFVVPARAGWATPSAVLAGAAGWFVGTSGTGIVNGGSESGAVTGGAVMAVPIRGSTTFAGATVG